MRGELPIWAELDDQERRFIRSMCERSFPFFVRFMFYQVQGMELRWNWHHTYLCDELAAIYRGEHKHVIFNCPPGSTKTELFSISFAAWCMIQSVAKGRDGGKSFPTRWLPVSYSDDLVKENTARVREIITSEAFQDMWPMRPVGDTRQKHNWAFIDENNMRHSMYGATPEGQVTGRRAGYMQRDDNIFTGALLIDDPLPPKADGSFTKMNKANQAMNRILRSRRARATVPIIMIQQRIGKGDTTEYMTGKKTAEKYRVVKIPAMIDREYVLSLPEPYQTMCIEDTGFEAEPVSYWEWKEPLADLQALKKADPYLMSSQYQQNPDEAMLEGLIWRREFEAMIEEGRAVPHIPIDPRLKVYTLWDLGINDDMTIWLYQLHGFEIRLIAFYKNRDYGIDHYITWLHDFRDKFGIRFAEHHAPHDIEVRELGNGKSRADTAKAMGVAFVSHERPQVKREPIDATRSLFRRFWIDTTRCEVDAVDPENTPWEEGRGGWSAIKHYQRIYDMDLEVFKREPLHNWASHPNDALTLISDVETQPDKLTGTKLRPNAHERRGTWQSQRRGPL